MEMSRTYVMKEIAGIMLKESAVNAALTLQLCDTPEAAAAVWYNCIDNSPRYTPGVENFVAIHLNVRRHVIGFQIIGTGTLDTLLVHAREVFRGAIIEGAHAVVLMHNHPSGDATPSDADVKVTRDMIRAGQLLKIEVIDHIVIGIANEAGRVPFLSLRALGHFFN